MQLLIEISEKQAFYYHCEHHNFIIGRINFLRKFNPGDSLPRRRRAGMTIITIFLFPLIIKPFLKQGSI
jgi:hypothetical protein